MKTLIIRLESLGDLVQITPLAEHIKRHDPCHQVVLLTKEYCGFIFENNPHVDKIMHYDLPADKKLTVAVLLSAFRLLLQIRKEGIDSAILLHNSKLFSLMLFLAGIRKRVGLKKNCFLTDAVNFSEEANRLFQFQQTVEKIGIPLASFLFPRVYFQGDREREDFITSNPGGAKNLFNEAPSRRLSALKYAAIYDYLIESGRRIIIVGSGDDQAILEKVRAHMRNGDKLADYCGKLSIKESVRMVGKSRLYIGNDSGLLHFAHAMDVTTLAFYTSSNSVVIDAKRRNSIALQSKEPCSPCFKPSESMRSLAYTCPHTRCIDNFDMSEVFQSIEKLLQ